MLKRQSTNIKELRTAKEEEEAVLRAAQRFKPGSVGRHSNESSSYCDDDEQDMEMFSEETASENPESPRL